MIALEYQAIGSRCAPLRERARLDEREAAHKAGIRLSARPYSTSLLTAQCGFEWLSAGSKSQGQTISQLCSP